MLAQLEPVVRKRARAEAAVDPAFAETRAIVVADATTKWGRLFATNVLHDDLPNDAVASVATLDLDALRDAFSYDERVLDMVSVSPKPGFVLLVGVGEGSGGTIGVIAIQVPVANPASAVLTVH